MGDFWLEWLGGYDLEPGDLVSASDGDTTKQLVVADLSVTHVDPGSAQVSGEAEAGSALYVSVWNENGSRRDVTAGANGQWTADFTEDLGDEPWQEPCEIGPGSEGAVDQDDDDGDQTEAPWRVPNPAFHVHVYPGSDDGSMWFLEWPEGGTLSVSVDNPGTPQNPDFQVDQPVLPSEPGEEGFGGSFGYPFEAGDIIEVTDGTTTKTHVVAGVVVNSVDVTADTVRGTAGAGAALYVFCDDSDVGREVTADSAGDWAADFSAPPGDEYDIQPGSSGSAVQADVDDDETNVHWRVPAPMIQATLVHNQVEGSDWPFGSAVLVTIDKLSSGLGVDFSETASPNQWGDFWLEWLGGYDLEPGDLVSASDGDTTKQLVVADLSVTHVDPGSAQVSGEAEAGSALYVSVWNENGSRRDVTAGANGQWTADFTEDLGDEPWQEPCEIGPGSEGAVDQDDDDGDQTEAPWRLPPGLPRPCLPG